MQGEADGMEFSLPGEGSAKGGHHCCLQQPNGKVKGRQRCTMAMEMHKRQWMQAGIWATPTRHQAIILRCNSGRILEDDHRGH